MAKNWGYFESYFHIHEGKLTNIFPNRIETLEVQETLGVAGGLAVASKIYGLTQADWTKIPIGQHADFDFNHLSCLPDRFINIEAKGSIVADNSSKSHSVSKHKANIETKKAKPGFVAKYDYKKDTCLGIITVADGERNLQSWIVDPEMDNLDASPLKIKLLKRMYFYHSIFRLISKRSYLTITLANRIRAIELSREFKTLDDTPLLNSNFEAIRLTESFVNSRSRNEDHSVIGRTFLIDRAVYFVGVETAFINTIIKQDFDTILSFKAQSSTVFSNLNCRLRKKRGSDFSALINSEIDSLKIGKDDENYLYFQLNIELMKNTAGLCVAKFQL